MVVVLKAPKLAHPPSGSLIYSIGIVEPRIGAPSSLDPPGDLGKGKHGVSNHDGNLKQQLPGPCFLGSF